MEGTHEVSALALRAAAMLGTTKLEATRRALELLLSTARSGGEVPALEVLRIAHRLVSIGPFTMDELIDEAYRDSPVFQPHSLKIQLARLLTTAGFIRKPGMVAREQGTELLQLLDSHLICGIELRSCLSTSSLLFLTDMSLLLRQ